MNRLFRVSTLSALVLLLFAAPAQAALYFWNVASPGSGTVDVDANWDDIDGNPGVAPGDGDLAIIKMDGVVNYDSTHVFPGTPNDVWVGDGTPNDGSTWPYGPHPAGEGHVVQTSGDLNYNYWFLIGRANAPGTSTYDISGGTITQALTGGGFRIGEGGATGELTMSNDASVTNGQYNLFASGGGVASLTMYNTSEFHGGWGHIGGTGGGSSTIELNDSAHIQWDAWMNLGEADSTCMVTLNDGSSIATDSVDFGWGNNTSSTGVFNGSSSITTVTTMNIGVNGTNASGSVTFNGTSQATVGGNLNVGSNGAGTLGKLIMNDGSMANVTGRINFGSDDADAEITLSDSTSVSAGGAIAIGNAIGSDSTVTMSGEASLSSVSWTAIGNNFNGGGSGEVFMSGNSTLSVTNNELEIAWGGTGILHIGDGDTNDNVVVSASDQVVLGWGTASEDTNARIDLNGGGTLQTPWIFTGHDGGASGTVSSVLNFNGGLLRAMASDSPANPFISNNGGSQDFQLNVMAGGANIDTNGFDDSITEPLVEDGGSPGGGLTKMGAGTLTLMGANTYTGLTSILEGTLAIDGSIPGDVDVASGAALGGGGTVGGNVTVPAGGSVGPGGSIGTLNVLGDMSLAGSLDVEYDSDNDMIDLLNVSGELDLTDGSLDFSDLGSSELTNGVYVLATYGSLVGDPVTENGLDTEFMSVDYNYMGSKSIALVKVPEPSTLVLAMLGLLFVGFRKRR